MKLCGPISHPGTYGAAVYRLIYCHYSIDKTMYYYISVSRCDNYKFVYIATSADRCFLGASWKISQIAL